MIQQTTMFAWMLAHKVWLHISIRLVWVVYSGANQAKGLREVEVLSRILPLTPDGCGSSIGCFLFIASMNVSKM